MQEPKGRDTIITLTKGLCRPTFESEKVHQCEKCHGDKVPRKIRKKSTTKEEKVCALTATINKEKEVQEPTLNLHH